MTSIAVMLCVAGWLLLAVTSCHHETGRHDVSALNLELDSTLSRVQDMDSLQAMASSFQKRKDRVGEMLALRYLGSRMHDQSLFSEAIETQMRGLNIASELADTLEMANAMIGIATSYRRMGDLRSSSTYLFKALGLCDNYRDGQCDEALRCRMNTLNGIGKIEIQLRNYTVADSVVRESLDCAISLQDYSGMAVNYGTLGAIKYYSGDIDSAWVYYRDAMKYNEMAGHGIGVALCHLHFGELHEAERRFSHAEEEYKMAYDELKQMGTSWYWLEACVALARVSLKLYEQDDAHRYLDEAETESRRINSKSHLAEAYEIRSELALKQNKSEEAFKYFRMSDALYDSIRGIEMDEEMRAQRINYERGRNSGELNVLTNDIVHLKRIRNIMGVMGLLLTILAAVIIAALLYAVRLRANSQRVLRQVEETRSLFFTNVVHQLRTPLSAIMGAIDGIIVDARKAGYENYTATQRENVEVIERQGDNLLKLVDQILEVGGVRSAIRDPEWQTGDAVPLIRMVVESYREQCVDRHIELSYASREASMEIDTMPDYLKTIVGNLIENAINYSRDFSKITIISRLEGDKFVIQVADNGMGISREDLPHVFEPFYRGSAAERIVDGVGIGLTVVRDMVMVMGGRVAADSMKDQGSVFTVTLPCRQQGNKVKKVFDRVVSPVKGLISRSTRKDVDSDDDFQADDANKPVILVVEDHNDVARLVGKIFQNKYAVHYASDGEQGLAKAQELEPQLIITDVKMPVMDGCELCRQIRASKRLRHIPVIMLSARTSNEDRIRGIGSGADAYLVKPFVREELEAWVNRLIENRRLLCECLRTIELPQPEDVAAVDVGNETEELSDTDFLRQFKDIVEEELNKGVSRLDMDAIALSFKMGESQLRRKIQSLTGKNVASYLTQLRMEKALRLLHDHPTMLVGEVAEKCGFADVAYFSRVFRLYYNMTPTQARQQETPTE